MSITKFRNSSARYMKYGLLAFLAVFVVSIFFGYSSYITNNDRKGPSESVIAVVNGQKINTEEFQKRYVVQQDMYKEMYKRIGGMSAAQDAQLRGEILSQLIDEQVILSAAETKGVSVGRREIGRERDKLIDTRIKQEKQNAGGKGGKMTDNEFDKLLRQSSPSRTLKMLRNEYAKELTDDKIRTYLMINKLETQLKASVGKVDDQRLTDNFRQLKIRHILILSNKAPEQAKRKAEEVQKKLKSGEDFAKMASQFSDDPSSKSKGGDIGFISVANDKDLQELKVGQTSGIIKLPYGYRIVKVEDSKLELPKDFDKEKKKYREQLTAQLQSEVMRDFFESAQKSAKVEVRNPEYKGYWLVKKAMSTMEAPERTKLFRQAIQSLDKATKSDDSNAAAYAEKAVIYQMLGESGKAIDVLVDILDKKQLTDHQELRIMLSQLYIQNNEKEKAVPHLKLVSEASYDAQTHVILKSMYQAIGHTELVAAEDNWMKENPEQMAKLNPPQSETPVKLDK